jgi:hypothetical protein
MHGDLSTLVGGVAALLGQGAHPLAHHGVGTGRGAGGICPGAGAGAGGPAGLPLRPPGLSLPERIVYSGLSGGAALLVSPTIAPLAGVPGRARAPRPWAAHGEPATAAWDEPSVGGRAPRSRPPGGGSASVHRLTGPPYPQSSGRGQQQVSTASGDCAWPGGEQSTVALAGRSTASFTHVLVEQHADQERERVAPSSSSAAASWAMTRVGTLRSVPHRAHGISRPGHGAGVGRPAPRQVPSVSCGRRCTACPLSRAPAPATGDRITAGDRSSVTAPGGQVTLRRRCLP